MTTAASTGIRGRGASGMRHGIAILPELPWRESIADVVTIQEDADGHIDLAQLEAELVRFTDRPVKIGSFSAASNVTGILSNSCAIADLLHRHGARFRLRTPFIKQS